MSLFTRRLGKPSPCPLLFLLTGLNPGPSHTWKSDPSAKVPSVSPALYLHFRSPVKTTLFSLLDYCNGLLPLSTLVSSRSTHCAVVLLLKTLLGSTMALSTIRAPCPVALPSSVAYSSSASMILRTPAGHTGLLSISLCAHHFLASGPTPLLFPWLEHPLFTKKLAPCYSSSIKSKLPRGFSWPSEPRKSLMAFSSFPSWHLPYFKVGI